MRKAIAFEALLDTSGVLASNARSVWTVLFFEADFVGVVGTKLSDPGKIVVRVEALIALRMILLQSRVECQCGLDSPLGSRITLWRESYLTCSRIVS
jgi:hypothetical protein